MDDYKYHIGITPRPTPRPRLGKYGAYNKSDYTKYKNDMIFLIKCLRIPHGDYHTLKARFLFPYPKKTPKKKLIDFAPLRKKCDLDNVVKGLMDALEKTNVINNDRQISTLFIEKKYTLKEQGYIEFELDGLVNK
tara:strand:+ start:990 stop:1394 length:405 start_codon:yes stop_codon:yes gene_type:complete